MITFTDVRQYIIIGALPGLFLEYIIYWVSDDRDDGDCCWDGDDKDDDDDNDSDDDDRNDDDDYYCSKCRRMSRIYKQVFLLFNFNGRILYGSE